MNAPNWGASHEPRDVVVVGDNAAILSSVAFRLGRPIVTPEVPSGETFVVWKQSLQPPGGPGWYTAEQRSAVRLATRVSQRGARPVLLLLEHGLPNGAPARLRADFGNSIQVDERYWIYSPAAK